MSVMIEMEHINRIFPVPGGTFQALKDIDAQIDAGTFTILKRQIRFRKDHVAKYYRGIRPSNERQNLYGGKGPYHNVGI